MYAIRSYYGFPLGLKVAGRFRVGLYEPGGVPGRRVYTGKILAALVITSYSIHYTKLYDVVSAHRTPDLLFEYAGTARGRGLACIIAGAGGAAHLPGMVAAISPLPVIGVPVKTSRNNFV